MFKIRNPCLIRNPKQSVARRWPTHKQHFFGHVNLWKDHVFEGFGTKDVKTRSFDFFGLLVPRQPIYTCQSLKRPCFFEGFGTKDAKTGSFEDLEYLFTGSPSTHVNLWKDHVFGGFGTKDVKKGSFDFLDYLFPRTPSTHVNLWKDHVFSKVLELKMLKQGLLTFWYVDMSIYAQLCNP